MNILKAVVFTFVLLPLQSFALDGRVVRIVDGDTLVQVKVRLSEIDAPETSQAYGRKSKTALASMCAGKPASLLNTSKDRYGRTLARVICADVDANASMVEQGFAWVYDRYVKDQSLYTLQNEAKNNRRGLWRDESPLAPWKYRKLRR